MVTLRNVTANILGQWKTQTNVCCDGTDVNPPAGPLTSVHNWPIYDDGASRDSTSAVDIWLTCSAIMIRSKHFPPPHAASQEMLSIMTSAGSVVSLQVVKPERFWDKKKNTIQTSLKFSQWDIAVWIKCILIRLILQKTSDNRDKYCKTAEESRCSQPFL